MQIFFNSSMPKSGSELIQVILHQNPLIYASPTSPLLEYQFAARSAMTLPEVQSQSDELMQKAFIEMCSSMAQGYYSAITNRPYVIDKSRGWIHYIEWIKLWCPQPKIICMVRDLRDIIASMEKTYRNNRHLPIGPDNPTTLQAMTINGRVQHWLSTQPVGLALQRTYDCISKGLKNEVHFVRYEDLCSVPEQTLAGIYRHLGLDYFEHDYQKLHKEVFENEVLFGPYGKHSIQPILNKSPTSWMNILGKNVGDHIVQQHSWYFEHFYADAI